MDPENNLDVRIFAAELRRDLPELDLHGLNRGDVDTRIDQFLYECHERNQDAAKIIYGAGKGILQAETLKILSKHPLVSGCKEGVGNCIVILDI